MLTTHDLTTSINFQTFTFAGLRLVARAVNGIEDDCQRIRAAVPDMLRTVATLLRILAMLVDFAAYVLIGAGRGVIVLAIGAVAVVALSLQAFLWMIELCTAADRQLRLAVA